MSAEDDKLNDDKIPPMPDPNQPGAEFDLLGWARLVNTPILELVLTLSGGSAPDWYYATIAEEVARRRRLGGAQPPSQVVQ